MLASLYPSSAATLFQSDYMHLVTPVGNDELKPTLIVPVMCFNIVIRIFVSPGVKV